ncbi:GTP-binding protein [Candidatus Nardonella dryophthoridicola]|uniref:GTP-binding protein n=1 Tax=Candidatus Nardonella dryophthoridicola TaxID=1971485 RepID=UPI001AD85912|nr:GTP-binding protein [Candidatus Nardonella dryophthoridicola]QTJ62942.1 GTP-binding protein [Candidatus Nardonella dryophthoridicola]
MYKNKFKDIQISKNSNIKNSIITILGHVNHGKTSILNRIINNTYMESRNITQHIKYSYIMLKDEILTFIDTPGHEDFYKIRNLSIKITDIIILVVSVDDCVNKQTIECINYIKLNSNIPCIIVINKIDKNYDKNKIINELSKYNIVSKEWGGKYDFIYTSSKNNIGINNIITVILKYTKNIFNFNEINNNTISKGIIIESYINKNEGLKTVLIIKKGIFKVGNYISTNLEKNKKIKSIFSMNENLNISIPSMPIEITGLNKIHRFGNIIYSYNNKNLIKNIKFNNYKKKKIIENNIINNINFNKNLNKINIILKTDVTGSCEVILKILKNIDKNINIVYYNIGNININDVNKALLSNSIIIGFNIKIDSKINKIIKNNKLIFNNYTIIYDLINDIKKIINKKNTDINKTDLNKIFKSNSIIKNIFNYSNYKIAGCKLNKGIININDNISIFRENKEIFNGKIKSMKILNNVVKEVKNNNEFGIIINNFNDIKINDILKSY